MASFKPNDEQVICIQQINQFIKDNKDFARFLINGSAGTGKTSILISSIINHFNEEIINRYEYYYDIVKNDKWDLIDKDGHLNHFIISAPTNKAKDVLITKYNSYLASLTDDDVCDLHILNEIVHKRIDFLTVSQVLSISRVINEMGEEEFTKGNDKKIADKYNKPTYNKTVIIIDECSMLDSNTTRILSVIKCPLIYIGDYCQLPPVNENLSPVFELESKGVNQNVVLFRLTKVERCKKAVTDVANVLRDKIYEIIPDFNILSHKSTDLIQYPKRMEKWLDAYVDELKQKLLDIKQMQAITNVKLESASASSKLESQPDSVNKHGSNDCMALAWTNKCCSGLNQKIRNKLFMHSLMTYDAELEQDLEFENIEDINDHFLIKGDKLLVKAPYYKYGHNMYSSSIAYVAKLKKVKYQPITFREWCNLAIKVKQEQLSIKNAPKNAEGQLPSADIDISFLLDEIPATNTATNTASKSKTKQKTVLDYFSPSAAGNSNDSSASLETGEAAAEIDQEELEKQAMIKMRREFFRYHTLNEVLTAGTYIFNDPIASKYDAIIAGCKLSDIKEMKSKDVREAKYMEWHRRVSSELFGIPIDRALCKKCLFFVNKFGSMLNKSCNVADMINATDSLQLNMFLTDLAVFTTSSNYINNDIPILDMLDKVNLESIARIRDIIKNSYEVKIILTKQDLGELKTINKMLGEDDNASKYITMSQMLGHYFSHVISSNYLEVDYGYALTVHKSQGSTYDDVFIEYGNLAANKKDTEKYKLLYTAITRSANKLHIYY